MNRDRRERRRDRNPDRDRDAWEQVELVDTPSTEDRLEPAPPRRPISARGWIALAVAAALLVAIVVSRGRDHSPAAVVPPVRPPSTASGPTGTARVSVSSPPPPPEVQVIALGRPLVPARAGWELFGRCPSVVVRLELATGTLTRTAVPPLTSNGPVSFVVGADRAIVRPLDMGPGYVIPDGRPVGRLDPATFSGGPAFPGPDAHHLWVATPDEKAMRLVDLDGRPTGTALPVPGFEAQPDGAGFLLFADTGGVYDARPDGIHRITSGLLQAIGPRHWLTAECDARYRCASVVIGRDTGARRSVGARRSYGDPVGQITADGTVAAVTTGGPDGTVRLRLLDLRSGRSRAVNIDLPSDQTPAAYLWSPDGHSLFVLNAAGGIVVVDRAGRVRPLGVTLPPLTQLAFRPLTR